MTDPACALSPSTVDTVPPGVHEQELTLTAVDGYALACTLWQPEAGNGAWVQIHPATAVPRGVYVKYGRYLASRGFVVATLDYRGIGDSLRQPIKTFRGRLRDWGGLDVPALMALKAERFPDLRHLAVVHSIGGQILGLIPEVERLDAVWGVGAQWPSWRFWPAPGRYANKALTLMTPAVVGLLGYFPGRWLGMGDLPPEIGKEWMRWHGSPHYIVDASGRPWRPYNHLLRAKARWNALWDDHRLAPAASVEEMLRIYPNADGEFHLIGPDKAGGAIGHFGFFRSRYRDTLWRESADWLESV